VSYNSGFLHYKMYCICANLLFQCYNKDIIFPTEAYGLSWWFVAYLVSVSIILSLDKMALIRHFPSSTLLFPFGQSTELLTPPHKYQQQTAVQPLCVEDKDSQP